MSATYRVRWSTVTTESHEATLSADELLALASKFDGSPVALADVVAYPEDFNLDNELAQVESAGTLDEFNRFDITIEETS
jgi:hypothetical protein